MPSFTFTNRNEAQQQLAEEIGAGTVEHNGMDTGMHDAVVEGGAYGHHSCCGIVFGTDADYLRHCEQVHLNGGGQGMVDMSEDSHAGNLGFGGSQAAFPNHSGELWAAQTVPSQFSDPMASVASVAATLSTYPSNVDGAPLFPAALHGLDPHMDAIFSSPPPDPPDGVNTMAKRRLSAAAFSYGSYNKLDPKRFREDLRTSGLNFGGGAGVGHTNMDDLMETGEDEADGEYDAPEGILFTAPVPRSEAMVIPRPQPVPMPMPPPISSRMPRPDLFPELAFLHQHRLEQQILDQEKQLQHLHRLQQLQIQQQRQLELLTQQTQIAQHQLQRAQLQQQISLVSSAGPSHLTPPLGLPQQSGPDVDDQLDYVIKNFRVSKIAPPTTIPPFARMPQEAYLYSKPESPDSVEDALGEPDTIAQTTPAMHKPYRCHLPNCTKAYRNSSGLKYHLQHGHVPKKEPSDRILIPEQVAAMNASDIIAGRDSPVVFKPYRCQADPACLKRYKNLNGLKYHLIHAHPEVDVKQALGEAKLDAGLQVAALNGVGVG
ncbi:Transcriptional regulator of ribosomal biogenesis proteins, partial [Rhizophlyctis rosea]